MPMIAKIHHRLAFEAVLPCGANRDHGCVFVIQAPFLTVYDDLVTREGHFDRIALKDGTSRCRFTPALTEQTSNRVQIEASSTASIKAQCDLESAFDETQQSQHG